jgi:uncharacterized membrane protein YbhN (UPF0104 family)
MAFFPVETMKKHLSLALRLLLVGGCMTYALWGVDLAGLGRALAAFRPLPVALYVLGVPVMTIVPGLRLRFLLSGSIRPLTGLWACLIGLALNNVLPARLGEMAKALYLRRESGASLGKALEAVFWERFFDLNALLVLGVAVAALLGQGLVLYPLLALVGGVWCFLGLLRVRPGAAHALLRLVPFARLRLFAAEMLGLLQASLRLRFLCGLGLWTLAAWSAYLALYALGLCFMAGLPWSWPMVLTVFAVATLGFAVPGAPGGMGVYEASMVLALGWFGVDRDRAFAVALAMHLLQYLPVTALGLWRVAASGMTLRELRAGAAAQ